MQVLEKLSAQVPFKHSELHIPKVKMAYKAGTEGHFNTHYLEEKSVYLRVDKGHCPTP